MQLVVHMENGALFPGVAELEFDASASPDARVDVQLVRERARPAHARLLIERLRCGRRRRPAARPASTETRGARGGSSGSGGDLLDSLRRCGLFPRLRSRRQAFVPGRHPITERAHRRDRRLGSAWWSASSASVGTYRHGQLTARKNARARKWPMRTQRVTIDGRWSSYRPEPRPDTRRSPPAPAEPRAPPRGGQRRSPASRRRAGAARASNTRRTKAPAGARRIAATLEPSDRAATRPRRRPGAAPGRRQPPERLGDAVGPGVAEDLLADLVQLGQVSVAHARHQQRAVRAQHARHLGDGAAGVGDVVQHVDGHHHVERRRPERQLLGVGHPARRGAVAARATRPGRRPRRPCPSTGR